MTRLQPLLAPASIAVVGANEDTSTYGGRLWGYLTRDFKGRVYAVNRRPGAVRNGVCVTNLGELPEAPDVVVLLTPSGTVADLLREAGALGVRSAIVFDRESLGRESELRAIAEESGMVLLGPNCLGLINANAGVALSSSISLDRRLRPGPLALVSQSGALMGVLHARATDLGLGLGLYVSTGSQSQLRVEDVLLELADRDEIQGVAVYLEDLDVPLFEAAGAALRDAGKPVIVLKGGLTPVGGRATAAHSRSLVSNGETFRELAAMLGASPVHDADELLAALAVCRTAGRRVHIATLSGGLAVVGADQADTLGLALAHPSEDTVAGLERAGMWPTNPLDMEAAASTAGQKADAVAAMAADPAADLTLVVVNDMPGLDEFLEHLEPVITAAESRAILCSACSRQEDAILREWVARGNSYTEGLSTTLRALAALHGSRPFQQILTPPDEGQLSWDETFGLLQEAGIPVAPGREVRTAAEAVQAANASGFPVVLKVARAAHRGVQGVRAGLRCDEEVAAAFDELRLFAPLLVQRQAQAGLEFYVGTTADPRFGLLTMVGMGGAALEGARDIAIGRQPLSRDAIRHLVSRTRVGRWLNGTPSRRLVDFEALVDIVCRALEVSVQLGPAFGSLDLNPVIVHPSGATVVDGKITLAASVRGQTATLEAQ